MFERKHWMIARHQNGKVSSYKKSGRNVLFFGLEFDYIE